MKERWETLHKSPRFRPQYPSEITVRFLFANFPQDFENRRNLKILDIGCGGGRHVKLLAEQGFDAYGIDFSAEGIKHTNEVLSRFNLEAHLEVGGVDNLPYADNFFDGAIAFAVFYYADAEGMRKDLDELHRVLKRGGRALVVTRTTDDYRFGKGKQTEPNTFILDISETNEQGMTMHFLNKEMVYDYCSRFAEIRLGRYDLSLTNLESRGSNWIITLEK
jgi:SAM-dependent methyltransferase